MKELGQKFYDLFNPVLKALHSSGGSSTVAEIEDFVIDDLKLSDEEVNDIHRGTTTKLNYRLRWARNYLKNYGLIDNSARGVWSLTPNGQKVKDVDHKVVMKTVQELFKSRSDQSEVSDEEVTDVEQEVALTWREEMLVAIKSMKPDAFERLCQRFLRELGFVNVDVTGKPNDGGIDGKGILRLGGILSFHVVFQAKRYKDVVTPDVIRDFRGSMSANADKGLVITTGRFTKEARREAQRDGALPIDLIDGDELATKLKDLGLGAKVEVRTIEDVTVTPDWFKTI